jgi:hypothetical protein
MRELGLDAAMIATWFPTESESPFVLIRVAPAAADTWAELLKVPVRRCYVADQTLEQNAARTGATVSDLVAARLPEPGSVMAGDFGEILAALYQGADQAPGEALEPKKWRLKQDRTKPAPYSDIVQFVLPDWPASCDRDKLLCAEVKTKSTPGASEPITQAIADSRKDQDGRLIKTLLWLRERAFYEELGTISLEHLDRFINSTDHPAATKTFRAVAVICASLVEAEIKSAPFDRPTSCTVVVISVPDLKEHYEAVYKAVLAGPDDGIRTS